jgi:translocation and assembly module TamA
VAASSRIKPLHTVLIARLFNNKHLPWNGLFILWIALVLVASGPTLSRPTATPGLQIVIDGVTSDLEKQIRAYIGEASPDDLKDLPMFTRELNEKIRMSLQAVGFYHPSIEMQTIGRYNTAELRIQIETGQPVRVKTFDVILNGAASTNSEFLQQVRDFPLRKGDIFNHQKYEQIKSLLISSARNLGYFDAGFKRAQVLITKKERQADIHVHFNSGERYSISQVNYQSELFPTNFLQRWQSFQATVPYRAAYVSDLTRNLRNSGYFKHVRVTPQLDKSIDHKVPLLVELESSSENIISLGAGYATDSGARVKGNWLRPHHNSRGHALEASASISQLRQQLSAGYRIPHKKRPETGNYSFDLGVQNHRTDDTFSQLRTFDLSDHRELNSGWHRDIFLRWENEQFRVGDTQKRINLLLPGISFSRTISTGGLYPKRGSYLSFKLLAGDRKLLSDIDLIRATASAKHLRSWNNKHFLIGRAELGGLYSNDFNKVPASHRFFAGGDASVRGFAYQSISPVNDNNESVGGQFLTTASLEYNYTLRKQWALAAFIDTGRAYKNASDPYRVGIGFGLRWLSPVGPLRVDVGYGISEEEKPVRLHLSIGPQL